MEMFKIDKSYKILLFDEYPILFIGLNFKNEVVVGSFLYEEEDNTLLYFRSIVSNKLALQFINEDLSYLNLLKNARDIFIIREDYNENIIQCDRIDFADIDESILPLPTAFCPPVDTEFKEGIREFLYGFGAWKQPKTKPQNSFEGHIFNVLENEKAFTSKHIQKSYYESDVYRIGRLRYKQPYSSSFEKDTTSKYPLSHA